MTNQLHRSLATKILKLARMNGYEPGRHVTEASLEGLLGTSRAPIRSALMHLAEEGVLERIPNRGFFVLDTSRSPAVPITVGRDDEAIYLAIADDRLDGLIPKIVSEPELMRRYEIARPRLLRILTRIAAEGWIERREGRGWAFVSLVDSIEAYRENYEIRQMLEPAGLLSDGFKLDLAVVEKLRAQQVMVRDGGWSTLSQIELFEANARFHEDIASMSGNRFLKDTIERQNQLRRLVEYRQTLDREQVRGQNEEHLELLDVLESGHRFEAAELLRHHLGRAKARKATDQFFNNRSTVGNVV